MFTDKSKKVTPAEHRSAMCDEDYVITDEIEQSNIEWFGEKILKLYLNYDF